MKHSKSSKRWLREHFSDTFVKQSKLSGYRSRAVYKLLAIQEKDKILGSGMKVVDLGAAPGGWSQLASKLVGVKGQIVAVDRLYMEPLNNVLFIQGDFTENAVLDTLMQHLNTSTVNVVLSDMAPNISGVSSVDQPQAMYLAQLAFSTAKKILIKGGSFVVKVFQGEGFDSFYKELKQHFQQVVIRKPEASRQRSREIYLVAKGYK